MEYPNYLYRPDDCSVFVNIGDGRYCHEESVKRKRTEKSWSYDRLMDAKFTPCTEDDFPELRQRHDIWRGYMNWTFRSDGHGGAKGGTMDEYFEYLERVRLFQKQTQEATEIVDNLIK